VRQHQVRVAADADRAGMLHERRLTARCCDPGGWRRCEGGPAGDCQRCNHPSQDCSHDISLLTHVPRRNSRTAVVLVARRPVPATAGPRRFRARSSKGSA
jgi:hypothetical protein